MRNDLLERFRLNIDKSITKTVNEEQFDFITPAYDINFFSKIFENHDFLITYYPEISKNTCIFYDLDYTKVLNSNGVHIKKLKELNNVSLNIASVVIAYARIYISNIKLDILNKDGKIYYSNADNILTDIILDKIIIGNDIGLFKLEYEIK